MALYTIIKPKRKKENKNLWVNKIMRVQPLFFLKLSFVFNSQFPTFDKTIDGICGEDEKSNKEN